MFQAMLVTGVTPLESKDETIHHWENQPFTGVWPESKNQKTDITRNRTIKKKRKRVRTAFTTDQIRALEKTFLKYKYINSENRRELSKHLSIGEKCIKIWFQNRRMKEKKETSESSDYSSEAFAREVLSPPLIAKPETTTEIVNHQSQYVSPVYYAPCNYYHDPTFHGYYTNGVQIETQVYEPLNSYTLNNNFTNSMAFCNENNPYPTQYYPSGETVQNNAEGYQNQYQYGDEMYNYCCTNNIDLYNIY